MKFCFASSPPHARRTLPFYIIVHNSRARNSPISKAVNSWDDDLPLVAFCKPLDNPTRQMGQGALLPFER